MSGPSGTQRSGANGFFVGKGKPATVGNDAMAGCRFVKAAETEE
jgi:hypothetical protein